VRGVPIPPTHIIGENMFFNTTVDDCIKGLTKIVTDLEVLIEKQQGVVIENDLKIIELQEDNEILNSDINRASSIRSKINALIG
jgi:hypothetical protein